MGELVSVIIPSYNHENYIRECINSILNQTYKNLEIIIEDDCSQDNTQQEIKKIKDKRIKSFFSEKNKGVVETMNDLLKKCNGKYIAIIGSDDVWYPEKIAEQVKIFKNNPKVGAVFTEVDIIDENGHKYNKSSDFDSNIFRSLNVPRAERLKMFYMYGNHLCHPSSMITKEVLENVGFYNKAYRQLHDYDYWVRVANQYDIYIINKKLMAYRRERKNAKSVSASTDINQIRTLHELFNINSQLINNISNLDFKNGFKSLFKNKNAKTKEELICEKYFLLLEMSYGTNNKMHAYSLIFNYPETDKIFKILDEEYNYTLSDFYNDTGEKNTLYSEEIEYKEYIKLVDIKNKEIEILNFELDNIRSELNKILNSNSWKITEPLRKIRRFKKWKKK